MVIQIGLQYQVGFIEYTKLQKVPLILPLPKCLLIVEDLLEDFAEHLFL